MDLIAKALQEPRFDLCQPANAWQVARKMRLRPVSSATTVDPNAVIVIAQSMEEGATVVTVLLPLALCCLGQVSHDTRYVYAIGMGVCGIFQALESTQTMLSPQRCIVLRT